MFLSLLSGERLARETEFLTHIVAKTSPSTPSCSMKQTDKPQLSYFTHRSSCFELFYAENKGVCVCKHTCMCVCAYVFWEGVKDLS